MSDRKPTIGDWLTLHDLTPDLCCELLALVANHPTGSAKAPKITVTCNPVEVWSQCGTVIASRMPDAKAAVSHVLSEARVNFAPDPDKYPRAFTLHDDGQGHPYVSIPWNRTLKDVLALAHEFGHAIQIAAGKGQTIPPATRETCALLAEIWAVTDLKVLQEAERTMLAKTREAGAYHRLTTLSEALVKALSSSETVYDYNWNYPVAQAVATLIEDRNAVDMRWKLYSADMTLRDAVDILLT
jgi:hypothetical protein